MAFQVWPFSRAYQCRRHSDGWPPNWGIACGFPIVGYRGEETAFPITEAGVLLADPGDLVGIAEALRRVLCDAKLRDEMRQRSLAAGQKYFSWDAITEQFLRALSGA